jgi:hypothetical protein
MDFYITINIYIWHLAEFFLEIETILNESNYKVYAYIVKHNYIWGCMLFTICKAQLHV